MLPRILTIIVTYNAMQWIDRCIGSVISSTERSDIMVIDNASDDGTPEYIEEHFPSVMLKENNANLGFGSANNAGLSFAMEQGYSFVYLLNQDAWVLPETFATLLRIFDSDSGKGFGILSPLQMTASMSKMDAQFKKKCAKALSKGDGEAVNVPFVMAAHWMVSRRCLETVGGFSPAFPHYGEDNDYINRARWYGFSAGVVRTAIAVHDRASRPRPKAYRMELKTVYAKTVVSDPKHWPFGSLLKETLWLLAMGLIHFSSLPWKGIKELWSSYDDLKRNRKLAKKKGAFL